jgi:hypothetical protein
MHMMSRPTVSEGILSASEHGITGDCLAIVNSVMGSLESRLCFNFKLLQRHSFEFESLNGPQYWRPLLMMDAIDMSSLIFTESFFILRKSYHII